MRANDLQLSVSLRKPACVLDPMLLLGHADGPLLAQRLARVFEAWLTRSFWQALDASDLLLDAAAQADADPACRVDPQALRAWAVLRDRTDAGHWTLRWVGDCLAESQIGEPDDLDLVERYEHLAGALAARWPRDDGSRWTRGLDPVAAAADTLALSAALDGALVLGAHPRGLGRPWGAIAAERAGLVPEALGDAPPGLFAAERRQAGDALARAGLAPLLQTLGEPPREWRLCVLHARVTEHEEGPQQSVAARSVAATGAAGGMDEAREGSGSDLDGDIDLDDDVTTLSPQADPWAGFRGWWYLL